METQGACLAKWQGVKYTFTPTGAASYVDREVLQSVGQHEAHLFSDQTNDREKGCFRILFTDFKKDFFFFAIAVSAGFCFVFVQRVIILTNTAATSTCFFFFL